MKFAADAMLGKLAKWLRILGYDTSYQRDIEDEALLGLAGSEGRFILTRDTRLIRRLKPGGYLFIRHDAPFDQLVQALDELGLDVSDEGVFSRCTLCNTPLERAERESVQGVVPEYTFNRVRDFDRCPACGRVYWAGTHKARMLERLRMVKARRG